CMTDNSGYYGTWSSTQGAPASPYFQNLYDPRADWAECYFDAKHILSSYAVYEIPFGRSKRFGHNINKAVDAVAGGWSINPIISYAVFCLKKKKPSATGWEEMAPGMV